MKKRLYWVWKDKDGNVDIETIRESKFDCKHFLSIRFDQRDLETAKAFRKRIGGKVIRVSLVKT